MGLIGKIILKGVSTAARNSTIKAVENAAINVITHNTQSNGNANEHVLKNGVFYIKPTRTSEGYLNESAFDVACELLGAGFENVYLQPINKLNVNHIKKYGKVRSVSIGGKKDFVQFLRVPSTTHIIIEFLDFYEDIPKEIYQYVSKLRTGKIRDVNNIEEKVEIQSKLQKDQQDNLVKDMGNGRNSRDDVQRQVNDLNADKHNTRYIKPTRAYCDYINKDTEEILRELFGAGFECVCLKAKKKLGQRAYKKYGRISAISINGNDAFLGILKVPSSSYIIIEYLDFKENVDPAIYKSIKRLKTGEIRSINELECASICNRDKEVCRFCIHCGAEVTNQNAKFCQFCGERFEDIQ